MVFRKARLHLLALIAATAFLLLWPGQQADADFGPQIHVELDGYWVDREENINIDSNLQGDDVMYDAWVQFIPPEWFVAAGADVPDGAYVGGTCDGRHMGWYNGPCNSWANLCFQWQDATTDTGNNFVYDPAIAPITSPDWPGYEIQPSGLERAVERYPNFLNDMGFPEPRVRYYSHISWAGMEFAYQLLIFEPGASLPDLPGFDPGEGYPSVMVIQDPTAPPSPSDPINDVCTNWSRGDSFWPWSEDNPDTEPDDESGYLLRRNPSDWDGYNFLTYVRSRPDADWDGIENDLDTCPFDGNWDEDPRHGNGPDHDGLDSACDPEWDVYNEDQDGDGYVNRGDNCPLVENGCSDPGCGPIWDAGWDNQLDSDGDGIGDLCDTEGDGPYEVDGYQLWLLLNHWVEVSGDSDGDYWSDALEEIAGSWSHSSASTPEGLWRTPWTCADGLDNDLDGAVDGYDLGCDVDDDGVPNMFDACPERQEDFDGFEDDDGCPEADNDMDGICDPWYGESSCWGSDDCPNVPEDYDSYQDDDGCPDADNDGDFFPDYADDCPGTDASTGDDGIPCTDDPGEINTCEDYDGIIDWDGCHDSPGADYDLDEFSDEEETHIGTDPTDDCPDEPGYLDAWPYDNNVDTKSNVMDVLEYKGHLQICLPDPDYVQRLDIKVDECVNVMDILLYKGHLQIQCTNP